MVVSDVGHIVHQAAMTAGLRRAIEFLGRRDLLSLSDGREEIDGERVFALVQRYDTERVGRPRFECHRKYIDVQYIASGEEVIGWAPAGNMAVTEAYDTGKDVCFGTMDDGSWTPVHLRAGQVMLLWPEDAHAPKGAAGAPSRVMKIVIKVAV